MIQAILAENKRRNAVFNAVFNPVTGEGSVGQRFLLELPDFPIRRQWLPVAMKRIPLVRRLAKAGSIAAVLDTLTDSQSVNRDPVAGNNDRLKVIEALVRIRFRHDFPFWAATTVYIKDKEPGKPDCLFRLNYPQRRYCEMLEGMRTARKPIRICMLKSRQWGGSTETDIYSAWMQLIQAPGLNAIILAHVNSASEKIKGMYRKMLDRYPVKYMHRLGETYDEREKKIVWDGNSDNTQRIPQRNCTISVGSSESPNSSRAGDYALCHISEYGLFKDTDKIHAADTIRSATSGILYQPNTMIVYESTADGFGTPFYDEYTAAKNGESQFTALFIPWFEVENYRIEFKSEEERHDFAARLYENRESTAVSSSREEPGQYLWWLWHSKGATLEAINWYIVERKKYDSHDKIAAEFPSDDIEAFVNNSANVFDTYQVEALRPGCRPPRFVGEVIGRSATGAKSLDGLHFKEDTHGSLAVWAMPETFDDITVTDRYLVVVDLCRGRTSKADFSVITVFDRLPMVDAEPQSVVAQWHGHTDMDFLSWKAAQIARFYDNALLVIESNTLESNAEEGGTDFSGYVLNLIADEYDNLYTRHADAENIRDGKATKYGFHTNRKTKPIIIEGLKNAVRDRMWVERDTAALDELLTYTKTDKGRYEAAKGKHDDRLMTRAIGLHVSLNEMDTPRIVGKTGRSATRKARRPATESTI